MKNWILALLVSMFVTAQVAYAHPPLNIDAEYDTYSGILEVYITHKTEDPSSHFIEKVTIELNGKNIIETKLFMQDDENGLSLSYSVPEVASGDVFVIKAYCNKAGSLSRKVTVE